MLQFSRYICIAKFGHPKPVAVDRCSNRIIIFGCHLFWQYYIELCVSLLLTRIVSSVPGASRLRACHFNRPQKANMDPKILHWSYRDFHEFPQQMLDEAEQLEEIYLKENFIPSLPIWLFEFTYLKFIQLSGNLLSVLPAEINQLKHLEHLDVSKNTLTELPITLTHLNKLQHLNVSENEIDTVHKGELLLWSNQEIDTHLRVFIYFFLCASITQISVEWNRWSRCCWAKIVYATFQWSCQDALPWPN